MKEKTILMSPDELHLMLRGSLQWTDVEPRLTTSKTEIRKLNEDSFEKQSAPKLTEQIEQIGIGRSKPLKDYVNRLGTYANATVLEDYATRLEGQPVIWLLGSVGLLTLSTWFYFVLFSK